MDTNTDPHEPNDAMGIEELWPERYEVDWKSLEQATNEDPFGEAAFELLKETGILAHLAAGLLPNSALPRDTAILSALILKASKLAKAMVVMTAHLGGDRQLALTRELFELLATLNYLLADDGTGKRFQMYVEDSLVAEREFLKTIRANVKLRGAALAVERSMQRSIERTAAAAGVADLTVLPGRRRIGWPNAEELLSEIGENVYPAYRSGSSVLHTAWADILRNHLVQNADRSFRLQFDDESPRPQPLYGSALLLADLMQGFLSKVHPDAISHFKPQLDSLHERLMRVLSLHSAWLDDLVPTD